MEILDESLDLRRFWIQVAGQKRSLLMLDYDGTLAPFVVKRDRAVPWPGVRERLETIIRGGRTRVVVVTGRSAGDILPLLGLDDAPEIWGSHGGERMMPDGDYRRLPLEEPLLRGLQAADEVIERTTHTSHLEIKPLGRAFHWRGLPADEVARVEEMVTAPWREIAEECGLELRPFDGGVELRVPGVDKGQAVATLLDETGGTSAAAYLGDDRTDEDAFRALGESGLPVMVRTEYRSTGARLWLKPPEDLIEFLQHWIDVTLPEAGK